MKKSIITSILSLTFAAVACAQEAPWPPQRESEAVFTERKLEVFKHGVKDQWEYAAPQRDTFLVLHPKQQREHAPLYVVLHSAGHGRLSPVPKPISSISPLTCDKSCRRCSATNGLSSARSQSHGKIVRE
jgi:hypothetical protein